MLFLRFDWVCVETVRCDWVETVWTVRCDWVCFETVRCDWAETVWTVRCDWAETV